jgi:hypothetical protein
VSAPGEHGHVMEGSTHPVVLQRPEYCFTGGG